MHSESVIQCWSKSEGKQNGHAQSRKKIKIVDYSTRKIRSRYMKKILQSFAIMLFPCTCAQEKTDLIKVMVHLLATQTVWKKEYLEYTHNEIQLCNTLQLTLDMLENFIETHLKHSNTHL